MNPQLAGIFFDLTGAAAAPAATGLPWRHVAAPLVITLVAVLSWTLRPHDRTVTGQCLINTVVGEMKSCKNSISDNAACSWPISHPFRCNP